MRSCNCCNKENNNIIFSVEMLIVNDINLDNNISIYYCENCNFYYSNSKNVQIDYDNYYKTFNNYKNLVIYSDKDEKCSFFLKNFLKNKNIKNIIDYGSGNCKIKELLGDTYNIDNYDIGMDENYKEYDCLLLSHVLEHIYDINDFIKKIKNNIVESGLLYIEVPNAEYYDKISDICPLQEINIEHINFFSKYALNKLLTNHDFFPIYLDDDYFSIKNSKYYVIRGIFKKNKKNESFKKYIDIGNNVISNIDFKKLIQYKNIYIYGCGQFLFKILNNITKCTNIISIIDDNPCYLNKCIKNINIINCDLYNKIADDNDVVLLTSIIHDTNLKNNIKKINKNILIITINDLQNNLNSIF